jgi:xylan 1,4-beta-xylosidase
MSYKIDVSAGGKVVKPYWKRMLCADRAGLSLRADVREHLAMAVRECGFHSLRQHGMFHDDMFVWVEKEKDFNFQYLFSNYDYYLSIGIRPFVELSFLPKWMASDEKTVFTCKCPACPPTDMADWRKLVYTTVSELVERYGIDEVRNWHFEVWNEPNIPFWSGTQAQYFELYRHAVEAVKSVDASLRVGGPATANFTPDKDGNYKPEWIEDFLAFCHKEKLPVDFVSTHPYPTDFPFDDNTKTHKCVVRDRMATFNDLTVLRKMVDASQFPNVEIHCNEWGSSPGCRDRTHDHVFSGTFHLENLLRSVGLVDSIARWSLSDITEEAVPGHEEFFGGWGIVSPHGLKKPAFHAFSFLNKCGSIVIYNNPDEGIAIFQSDANNWQVLIYNHHPYASTEATTDTPEGIEKMIGPGNPRNFNIELSGMPRRVRMTSSLVDRTHGWAEYAWRQMGAPKWPNAKQLEQLRIEQEPAKATKTVDTADGYLEIKETVGDLGMLLIEIEAV